MEQIDNIINELFAKLVKNGVAKYSNEGLNIETSYDNGCFEFKAEYASPSKEDPTELRNKFEDYIKSLADDFFIETVETFEDGVINELQNKIDSDDIDEVKEGIDIFMNQLKKVASEKIATVSEDIKATEKELSELVEIRDSYIHVVNKVF